MYCRCLQQCFARRCEHWLLACLQQMDLASPVLDWLAKLARSSHWVVSSKVMPRSSDSAVILVRQLRPLRIALGAMTATAYSHWMNWDYSQAKRMQKYSDSLATRSRSRKMLARCRLDRFVMEHSLRVLNRNRRRSRCCHLQIVLDASRCRCPTMPRRPRVPFHPSARAPNRQFPSLLSSRADCAASCQVLASRNLRSPRRSYHCPPRQLRLRQQHRRPLPMPMFQPPQLFRPRAASPDPSRQTQNE